MGRIEKIIPMWRLEEEEGLGCIFDRTIDHAADFSIFRFVSNFLVFVLVR